MTSSIPTRSKLIVLTAVLASLLEIIDTSIVNVAVPTMMGNLGTTLDEISWVITGYIIANAIVLPIAGWMSQQIGRKLYYTSCIILFTASSAACGLAPNLTVLVLFRVLQGFAGGALLPTSQALIYESFPREQAGMASAIYGMSVMIGPTLGPTLGGYLTDNFGWRSIFNINVPIGVVVAILSYLLVEDVGYVASADKVATHPPQRNRAPVDGVGLALLIVGIGGLQYVLERGHADDWFASQAITISAIASGISLVALVWWELRVKHPILQLHHFVNVTFRSGVSLMFAMGCMLYGLIFIVPVFVDTIQGFTATQTGMLFIPGALCSAMMMPFIGKQLRKGDPRKLILVGVLSLAFGAYLIGRFDLHTSKEGMFWPLLVRGGAMAYLFVPINTMVLSEFQGAAIGEAAGMLNLSRQLGGSICIALMSTLFQTFQWQSYVNLLNHLTWFDPAAVNVYQSLQNLFKSKMSLGIGITTGTDDAIKLLFYQAQRQAFVLGYQKVLGIAVVLFLILALIPLALMKPKTVAGGPIADAH